MPDQTAWPALPYADWRDTAATLQLWTQIVGKVRLATTPWLNHGWHVTLYVSARGLTTGPMHHRGRVFEIEFDFHRHVLEVRTGEGKARALALEPRSVADFHAALMAELAALDLHVDIVAVPNEVADPIPFAEDRVHAAYDADAARRFWRVLADADRVFKRFRSGFLGKASPVHLFWGSFDLAVTRFSGRPAPPHPGGVPGLPDRVTREAYSHEVSSAGFWPGGGAVDYPAFYSYAYPAPEGFAEAQVEPGEAFFHQQMGEFILPYDAVRAAAEPDAALMAFLQTTYEAAADRAGWDRAALECPFGTPKVVRPT